MYEKFYNLREKPFELTPSRRFVYLSEGHKEALSLLKYGVLERKGFILLTGEVGTGKTTMVRTLLHSLNSSILYVHLSNPLLSPQEFINYLAYSTFKKEGYINAKAKFLLTFQAFLKRCLKENKNFNLIIDEAHKLSFEVLEEIRLLSNMETGDQKLMNIFLVGQPELNEKLSERRSRPLLQRISIRHHIPPLNLNETREYMITRLKVAGGRHINYIFSKNAVTAVYEHSHGYPREINILADNALLLGYARGKKRVSPDMVKASYEDLKLDHSFVQSGIRKSNSPKRGFFSFPARHWKAVCILLLVILISVVAPSRHGKPALSKLKALIPQIFQTEPGPDLPEPAASRDTASQENEDIPKPEPRSLKTITGQTGQAHETDKNGRQFALAEPLVVDPEIGQEIKGLLPYRSRLLLETETNKTNDPEETDEQTAGIDKKRDWKTVTVKKGNTFSQLVLEVYGQVTQEYIALVKQSNPGISDINRIEIGQEIVFPPIDNARKNTEDRRSKTEEKY